MFLKAILCKGNLLSAPVTGVSKLCPAHSREGGEVEEESCHLGPLHNAVAAEAGAMIIPLKVRAVVMILKTGDKAASPQQDPHQTSMGDYQALSKCLKTLR